MKTIRELTENKPSNAIFAMIEGLKEQSEREDFRIKMLTFGTSNGDYCFGCAATCTIQKISKINLTIENINTKEERANALGFNLDELTIFEDCIDNLRNGTRLPAYVYYGYKNLLNFYGINDNIIPDEEMKTLNSWDWHENLQPYINYANKLKSLGL